jgi:tetratricopeptide (TPR) repeat protein
LRKFKKIVLLFALVGLFFLAWHSARAGYGSLLTKKALATRNLVKANTAVRLSPGNPQAHVILGALLEANDDRADAIPHYEMAVNLRPQDYVLRMQLARGQELEGDTEAAINSARVAASLAPSYAQPHWQLGNILVRAGRADEGFSELRLAGTSDPSLLPATIDLAWQLSRGKVDYVIQAIHPQTPDAYKALAAYFLKRGQAEPATKMFAAAGSSLTEPERRASINDLISAKKFREAHSLWMVAHPPDPDGPLMFAGGFEEETDLDEPGFGWRAINSTPSLKLSLDNSNPQEGRSSLRIDFNGESNAASPVISQLVLLEPKTRYQLLLAYRTENLVSGGLPTIVVLDASDNKVLGQTEVLPQTTEGWRTTKIDFTTGESTTAIQIALQRQPCPAPQCPIFGKLWLDSFVLNVVSPRSAAKA